MRYEGRERRRKDPVGRLRRLAYGFLLWTAVPAASAADETLGYHEVRFLDADSGLAAKPVNFGSSSHPGTSPRWLQPRISSRTLFSFRFEDELSILRKGVGFDLALPQLGTMYLNLYARDDISQAGKRWKLHDEQFVQTVSNRWRLGGTVDLVRDDPHGSRQININPQLQVDLDDLLGMRSRCEASFQYANWKGTGEDAPVGRVPQVQVRWHF